MNDIDKLKYSYIIVNMVRGLQFGIEENLRALANKLGTTYPGLRILWILQYEKQMTITRLSKMGLWDISTTQRIVTNLRKRELVEINKSKEDSRIRLVSLTQNGWNLIESAYDYALQMELNPDLVCALEKAMNKYGDDDFRKFIEIGIYMCTELISEDYVNWVYNVMETSLKRNIKAQGNNNSCGCK